MNIILFFRKYENSKKQKNLKLWLKTPKYYFCKTFIETKN